MKFQRSPRRLALIAIALAAMFALPAVAQTINEDFKLLPFDGSVSSRFGHAVAMSDSTVVVGAYYDNVNGENSGSVYLFDIPGDLYGIRLLPDDGSAYDDFGHSVAISGTTAVVGARGDDDNGSGSGSAYIFDTLTGQLLRKLLPSDGTAGDDFGHSVAISGSTVLVGAQGDGGDSLPPGSAYLFDAATGQQIAKLLPTDGSAGTQFGYSLGISGNTAIVGTLGDLSSAYLFDATTGQQIAELVPTDGVNGSRFGYSVAISGSTAIVGAYEDDDNGEYSGSAYLFDTTTGQQIAKLLPNDGGEVDAFGYSVSIHGTTAIVGAPGNNDYGEDSGAVYVFETTTGQQIAKLLPSDGAAKAYFGIHIALSGSTAVVGADYDPNDGMVTGSAYTFTIPSCAADLNNDDTLNFFDVSAFLAAYQNQDPIADFTNDGSFDFFDVSAFIVAYTAGCP
ncbi:MAG: FG-GAP repeat protein [Phycisphaerales bacterium]|nr:FG-GAP repeat protein [Phycisphaerales bacterium]